MSAASRAAARLAAARGSGARSTRVLRQALGRGERALFPEAASATEHWQRVVMYQAVDQFLGSLDESTLEGVEISGDTHAERGWRTYTSLMYPEFDLCAPLEDRGQFDVVICEQVLEHVEDPWAAVSNLHDLCTLGGHVILSTPFLIRIHELPLFAMHDYWRFTPRGLERLLEQAGLEVQALGSWGNRECVVGNFRSWAAYRPWQSLRNERDFPVQVWAFARRPEL